MTTEESHAFCVVTPNFNMGQYLARTIESVIQNLRPGDQYFIIDGGSTDNSVDVIKKYEKHLTGWISEPDKGYADAIAKGFSRSDSDYMCWINSGDLLLEGALDEARIQLSSLSTDMIFGDDFYIDETDKVISHSCGRVDSLKNMMLFGGWTPLQDACFWKRDLYNAIGGFDVKQKYAADYDLFLRMSMVGRCEYIPAVFSAFRKHVGQKSIQGQLNYKSERTACRANVLYKSKYTPLSKWLLITYYWVLVRVRSRILRSFYRSKINAGESVLNLLCCKYK